MRRFTKLEMENQRYLVNRDLDFTLVQLTATGMHKSIMDATLPIREFFIRHKIHDYSKQGRGAKEHGVLYPTVILTESRPIDTQTSLYKPQAKPNANGDPRFWIYDYQKYVTAEDIHAIFHHEGKLFVVDITRIDISKCCDVNESNPIKDAILSATMSLEKVSDELLQMFRKIEGQWIRAEIKADTGIGRTVETLLGIKMNSSSDPDYKGIELKSFRDKRPSVKKGLFSKVPNWDLSRLKNGTAIADAYGKDVGREHKTLHHTVQCPKPNSFNLRLNLDYKKNHLQIEEDKKIDATQKYSPDNFKKVKDVVLWELDTLHQALLKKHKETFWIEVESRIVDDFEEFKIKRIEHTKNPVIAQFDSLVERGEITAELLLCRKTGGDTYSFKIKKRATPILFPEHEFYDFV